MKISLGCFVNKIELKVSDNGIGFDIAKVRKGGLGMKNMHERARLLNGDLKIESKRNKGTTISFFTKLDAE
jgi:signal transduction histidine kinase